MTRKTYFYARSCRHGINVTTTNIDGSFEPMPGLIVRFATRAARDAWVNDGPVRNFIATREAVTLKQIAHKIAKSERYFRGAAVWHDPDGSGVEELV